MLGLLNEPSAASIEYGHRNRSAESNELVLVYDLGGGTFDASLVRIEDRDAFGRRKRRSSRLSVAMISISCWRILRWRRRDRADEI